MVQGNSQGYWSEFYRTATHIPNTPSSFAKLCIGYMKYKETLIDLGCGNCRDTMFFMDEGIDALGVDWAGNALVNMDVCALTDAKYDNVYIRFLLHTLTPEQEMRVLSWAAKNGRTIFIETMSDKGKHVRDDGSYVRPINLYSLEDFFLDRYFDIVYFEESKGLSVLGGNDPMLLRLICRRRK